MKRGWLAGAFSGLLLIGTWLPAHAELPLDGATLTSATPAPAASALGPLLNISQTLNNCGPASVAEVLDFYGIHKTQSDVQTVLRADGNAGGMAPFGIPGYMRSLGMSSLMGEGGSDAVIKGLVANGFPVIVSQWVSLSDHYGHYRPIQSYSDQRGVFVSSDPYLGQNHAISYDEFDTIWATSNNRFYVLYPPVKQPLLNSVLAASGWDPTNTYMADVAIQQARLNSGQGAPPGYTFRIGYSALAIAWDELQLGDVPAAQRALDYAAAHGTSRIQLGWISDEIRFRTQ